MAQVNHNFCTQHVQESTLVSSRTINAREGSESITSTMEENVGNAM